MNKQEIKDFIVKANGKPIRFFFFGEDKIKYPDCNAAVIINPKIKKYNPYIIIHEKHWKERCKCEITTHGKCNKCLHRKRLRQRETLLHELGHINDPLLSLLLMAQKRNDIRFRAERELTAQIWAINKAIELNMHHTAIVAKQQFKKWKRLGSEKLKIAYQLAKEEGVI
jgi:hypothetical protein